MKIRKFLNLLLIALITFIVCRSCQVISDCYERDGAAVARVYCDILDDRESY